MIIGFLREFQFPSFPGISAIRTFEQHFIVFPDRIVVHGRQQFLCTPEHKIDDFRGIGSQTNAFPLSRFTQHRLKSSVFGSGKNIVIHRFHRIYLHRVHICFCSRGLRRIGFRFYFGSAVRQNNAEQKKVV